MKHGLILFSFTLAATALAQAPAPDGLDSGRKALKNRLTVDPERKAFYERLAAARKTPPVENPPPMSGEKVTVTGELLQVVDDWVLLAVDVTPATLEAMPWVRPVTRPEELDDLTAFEGRLHLRYDLSVDRVDPQQLSTRLGRPVQLEIQRDVNGRGRVVFVRFP